MRGGAKASSVILRSALAAATILVGSPASSAPSSAAFVYCSAASTSPRGPGLIVTSIFRSRSETEFVKSAFVNYLRTSYAPYGNSWMFTESRASCLSFDNLRKAEVRRSLEISRIPQPTQSIFPVTFQMG